MNPFNSSNGLQLENESSTAECSNREIGSVPRFEITYPDGHSFQEQSVGGTHLLQNDAVPTSFDCESTDRALKHIDQLLMGEVMDEETRMLLESLDFQAKERSFYEVVGKKYPPSAADDNYHNSTSSGSKHLINSESEVVLNFQKGVDDANKMLRISGSSIDEGEIKGYHLKKNSDFGEEETSKKLPTVYPESTNVPIKESTDRALKHIDQLLMGEVMDEETRMLQESLDFEAKERSFYELLVGEKHPQINDSEVVVDEGKKEEARGKKKNTADFGEEEEEERSKKLPATYPESNDDVPMEEFDNVLICKVGELEKKFKACTLQAKGRHRFKYNQNNNKEMIDFRALLINCAKSIAVNDRHAADKLLIQIREHSSPFGDGEQRLAHYFAHGLDLRLAGTGGQMQNPLLVKRTTASDYLRAYYTYIESSPFVKISHFASSKTIFDKSSEKENTVRVHIIDFGILYGFQWPTCFKHLSEQEGGPPKIKITGIDFPETGFRPAERVEETGRRLARYAKMFNVPFEFNAIAKNWESIKIDDLKLEKGEFVAVNCLYQAENLLDEVAGGGESPRTMVLDLIKKIKPDYFIHGVVNASYGLPFFVSRFREALFHYSTLYDMLETTIPREKPERAMLERDVFGKEALHVIACEDRERLGRTETYKQWQLRHLRAGFVQIPFGRDTMGISKSKVRNLYHKDFLIHEDKEWLLMGWKGKVLYAVSCWLPVSENA